jgi:hypothetical protein
MQHRASTAARCAVASVLATLIACADIPTSPQSSTPDPANAARTTASGVPTGKTVVVFADTASIPAAGLALLGSLGGTVTTSWNDIGVAFVTGLSAGAISTLAASDLVAAVGNDRILNWLGC